MGKDKVSIRSLKPYPTQKEKHIAKAKMSGTPDSAVRFGILGSANLRKVARAIDLAPNSTLHAVAGESFDGLPDTVKIYGSYDEVLDDPNVDAVYFASVQLQWAVLAALKKKHVLMETPAALDAGGLDKILEACESNGVQFMDASSMWLHHPRTTAMKQELSDSTRFGHIHYMNSTMTTLASDIRINPDMDALGAIGEMVWNCLGAALWVQKYELPSSVTVLPGLNKSSDGVILSCTASIHYNQPDLSTAIIHCSLVSSTTMDLEVTGSDGLLCLQDLIIPHQETSATFAITLGAKFTDLYLGWTVKPEKVVVDCKMPQEALMVEEFASLVEGIKRRGCQPDGKWPEISRKTQVVFGALNKSINLGCKPVYL